MASNDETQISRELARAQGFHGRGQLDAARAIYSRILEARADHFVALSAMGAIASQCGDVQSAIRFFDRAAKSKPEQPGAHRNLGIALMRVQQFVHALACFDRAIALDPRAPIDHFCRGEVLRALSRPDDALANYGAAVAIDRQFADAWYARGVLLHQKNDLDGAIASYEQMIRINPKHFEAHANRAQCLLLLGDHAQALEAYDRALALRRDVAPVHVHRGNVLRAMHRHTEALASYDYAISLDPNSAEALNGRGAALLGLDRVEAAVASFTKAIAIKRDFPEALFNRAHALRLMNRFEQAAADYNAVAALAPTFDFLAGAQLESSHQICDWTNTEALLAQISEGIEAGRRVTHPLILMALLDSPRLQRAASAWTNGMSAPRADLGAFPRRARPPRLKIGYFSADFHEHPVGRLIVDLIETHDRERFEILAFSFGPDLNDEIQTRFKRAFDRFIDVKDKSDREVAMLARQLNVDIAIDLTGFAANNRSNIFALRAAPLQVSYLGYVGSMGASYIDYIVADRTVVTLESEGEFSEKIIYLPDCFQVNDRKRRIADRTFTRGELGLPEDAFVFCCFNANYKILPATFAAWMRILKNAPSSVLMLFADQPASEANLRKHAQLHEVDPKRLVFVGRLPPAEYLARCGAADLFLDTAPYNGGTTVSDALWAGLPVLTLAGQAFASRMAASLLKCIDLPGLVANSPEEYEAIAISLASDRQRLAEFKDRLRLNRLSSPLFDTPRFARHFEAALLAIYERHESGLPPESVEL